MAVTDEELLETFDEHGGRLGLVPRARVHAEGLWHCAAHVWLFDRDGLIYIQRRSEIKDLNPGCWDVSVGEHLQPGESYAAAAARGLSEELGTNAPVLTPLGGVRLLPVARPERGIYDYEFQQAFKAVTDETPVPAPGEVAAIELVERDALRAWLDDSPDAFSPGFHADVADLALV